MANTFYTAEQVAKVAVSMAREDAFLAALIGRNLENDLLGGGGKGRTVNVKVPSALIARQRGIDETTAAIILDSLSESTVPVTLGTHAYSAVGLSEGDLSLNLTDFSAQVLAPQMDAVVDFVEHTVSAALEAEAYDASGIIWDAANPVATFTKIRKALRDRGVPAASLNVVVGTEVYASLLDAKQITDVSESGSTDALRLGQVGNVRGMTVVESTRVDENDIVAFHRDAFTLAVRAPVVPAGASFGQTVNSGGFALRYLRDYDVMHTLDRSLVSTFVGVAKMPLYKVVRDYTAQTASVVEVPEGAVLKVNTLDTNGDGDTGA